MRNNRLRKHHYLLYHFVLLINDLRWQVLLRRVLLKSCVKAYRMTLDYAKWDRDNVDYTKLPHFLFLSIFILSHRHASYCIIILPYCIVAISLRIVRCRTFSAKGDISNFTKRIPHMVPDTSLIRSGILIFHNTRNFDI